MQRSHLEHLLRAAAAITGKREFVIVGSQAIPGSHPDASPELLRSMEAALFCPGDPGATDLIDGTIGELSPFHETFRCYAHGVGPDTAVLPAGWESRVVRVASADTGGALGLRLDPNDLAVSKLAAGREKDAEFLTVLFAHALADPRTVAARLAEAGFSQDHRGICLARLRRIADFQPKTGSDNRREPGERRPRGLDPGPLSSGPGGSVARSSRPTQRSASR